MRRIVIASVVIGALVSGSVLAQRTSVSGDFPIYDNKGLPDLTVDPKRFVSQMEIVDRLFQAGDCEFVEGSVGGAGYRRLLRFDTAAQSAAGAPDVITVDNSWIPEWGYRGYLAGTYVGSGESRNTRAIT